MMETIGDKLLSFLREHPDVEFSTPKIAELTSENYDTVRTNLPILASQYPFIRVKKIGNTNFYTYTEKDKDALKPLAKKIKKIKSKSKRKLLTTYYSKILPKIQKNAKLTDKELSVYKTLFPKSSDWRIHSIHLAMKGILTNQDYLHAKANSNYIESKIKLIRKLTFDYGSSTIFIAKNNHTLEITFHVSNKHEIYKHGISYIHFFEGWFECIREIIKYELDINLKDHLSDVKINQFHVNYDSIKMFKSLPSQSMLSLDYFSDFLYQLYPKEFNILREEIQYLPKKEDRPFSLSELQDFSQSINENPLIPLQISQMKNDLKTNNEKIDKTNDLFLKSLKNIQKLQFALSDKVDQYESTVNLSNSDLTTQLTLLKNDVASTFSVINSTLEIHVSQQKKFLEYFNRYMAENSGIQTKSFQLHQELVTQMTDRAMRQDKINENLSKILTKLTDKPSFFQKIKKFFGRKRPAY